MSTESKKPIEIKTLVMLHGFGVRGFFWDPYKRSSLEHKFHQIFTPDLDFTNVDTAIESTKKVILNYFEKYGKLGPIFILGHSLGGILASIAAKDLGTEVIKKVIIIASPYGENNSSKRTIGLQRWFIKNDWLLPGFLTRSRFFTKNFTPKKIQKDLWKKAVKETDEMIDKIIATKWFHSGMFDKPLAQETLIIASRDDKVVKIEQVEEFAKVIGAKTKIYEKVGHDDLIYAPNVANKVINDIIEFF
ncbi:MAG: 2-succinyl-6-hydroxy-2,4-cyclohexadiene-1-carboxylate synthase [Candidatus Heimdallarchaeota archaeon LC_3]|nr:MAG: 2-succinyl-6-hydroxy-2,4-cyclohexadiene-1-carboxylate synthase [Candidatus Heimdallarchaeota archaeon LC_3]